MTFCVGTMSSKMGWETKSIDNAMGLHFYYWFVSRESQSTLVSSIPSFYALWQTYGGKKETMVSETQSALQAYMQLLFPTADSIKVTCNSADSEQGTSLYILIATVVVTINKINYDLNKAIQINAYKFQLLDNYRLNKNG